MRANGQLNRKVKVVREPKSLMDMVIPCQVMFGHYEGYDMKKFDDYEIVSYEGNWYNNKHYKVRCKVCGHEKVVGLSNLKKQDNHHSKFNCGYDFYKEIVGKVFGDYKCINVHLDSGRGYLAELECQKCGHKITTHASKVENRKHNAFCCGSDYYNSEIGKIYGDYEVIGVSGTTRNGVAVKCRCVKCGTESIRVLRPLATGKFKHGTQCLKAIPKSEYKNAIVRRFKNIQNRCNNPKCAEYKYYGGRGIKCNYKDVVDFYYDVIDKLIEHSKIYGLKNSTFDRINANGNYEKGNIRIATRLVQSTNTRRRVFFIITNGKETILSDNGAYCCRYLGLNNTSEIGNVVKGRAKTAAGWWLVRIVPKEEVPNIKDVTTNLVISL